MPSSTASHSSAPSSYLIEDAVCTATTPLATSSPSKCSQTMKRHAEGAVGATSAAASSSGGILAASSTSRRRQSRMEAIKLDFEDTFNHNKNKKKFLSNVSGRSKEVAQLRSIYQSISHDVTTTATSSAFRGDVIFLHGKAGVGKTALIESTLGFSSYNATNSNLKSDDDYYDNNDYNNANDDEDDDTNWLLESTNHDSNFNNNLLNTDNTNNSNIPPPRFYARAKFELPVSTATTTRPSSTSTTANLDPIARACADLCEVIVNNNCNNSSSLRQHSRPTHHHRTSVDSDSSNIRFDDDAASPSSSSFLPSESLLLRDHIVNNLGVGLNAFQQFVPNQAAHFLTESGAATSSYPKQQQQHPQDHDLKRSSNHSTSSRTSASSFFSINSSAKKEFIKKAKRRDQHHKNHHEHEQQHYYSSPLTAATTATADSPDPPVPPNVMIREERAFEQLKVLISKFFFALCSAPTPATTTENSQEGDKNSNNNMVVLFFDDIQWADEGCLEIIRYLAAGQQKGLLLILAQRDDDDEKEKKPNNKTTTDPSDEGGTMPSASDLSDNEQDVALPQPLASLEQQQGINITKMTVRELDMMGVNEIISGLTHLPPDETVSLAKVVHDKTGGNAFFVTQFLRSMEEEGYLYYSSHTMKWKWDIETIESQMSISDNVVDLVTHKIQKLPQAERSALMIAACLGSTIHTKIVEYVATQTKLFGNHGATTNAMMSTATTLDYSPAHYPQHSQEQEASPWIDIFDSLADEGLVNKRKRGSRSYVWSHDRILESAYKLMPDNGDDQQHIHLLIGQALKQLDRCPLGESWKLITATNQLNRASGIIVEEAQRVELAGMNLKAAKTVASISAFYQATQFLHAGIKLLDVSTMWTLHYALCLELHNSCAEMEKYIGHHDACRQAAMEVLQNGRTLNDQFRSYMVLIDSYGAQGKFDDLMKWVHELTSRLGQPLPQRPRMTRLIWEIHRTIRMIGKQSDEDLLGMPPIVEERVLNLLSLFNRLHRLTWNSGKIPLTIFIRVRMMQLFLQHGCSEFSGPTLALFGSILSKMGKLDEAYRFGMLALKFSERFPIEETQTSIYVFVHLKIIKKPLSHSIEPLLRAHRSGLEKGDSIVSGALGYTVFYFYQGLPLSPMHEDARAFAIHMAQAGNVAFSTFVNFFRQLALNFMGRSDNFLVLSGEAIDLEKIERIATEQKNHVMLLFSWTSQLLLACFSFDRDLSIAMFQKLEKADLLPEFFPGPAILGLVSAFLARSTGNRKYARRATAVMKQLQGLLQKGSVNYLFYHLLLKAELSAYKGSKEAATKFFEAAMRAAAQSGLTNFEALAAERFGIYTLERDGGDTFWAETYLSRALFRYMEWGAQAKVDSIRRDFPFITSETSFSPRRSTHHMGRRRLNVKDAVRASFQQVDLRFRFRAPDEDDSGYFEPNNPVRDSLEPERNHPTIELNS